MHVTSRWEDASAGFPVLDIAGRDHPILGGGTARYPARVRARFSATLPAAEDQGDVLTVEGQKARRIQVPYGQRLWLKSNVGQMSLDIERLDVEALGLMPYWTPVEVFGPVGTADDYETLQAAFSSGQPIELGPRDYLCGSALVVNDTPVAVRGVRDRSRIVFINNTPGIQIYEDQIQSVWLEDFCIWTKTVCDHTALSVDRTAYVAGRLWRHWPLQYFRGLNITSEDNTQWGWKRGIVLDQCTDPKFDDLFIEGRSNTAFAADDPNRYWGHTLVGISIQDTMERIVVGSKLTNCFIIGCGTGVEQLGPAEGLALENCAFVGCNIGVNDDHRYMDTLTGAGHPGLTMIGCHANCGSICVKTQNEFFGVISHCLFYEWIYCDLGWTGIHHEFGNGMKMTFNEFRADATNVAGRGIGIFLSGSAQSNIFGNHFTSCREPIVLSDVEFAPGETFVRNNSAHGFGGEQTLVIYDGAVNPYLNPASSYGGIIAEASNDALISLSPGVQSTLPGGVTILAPVGARYRINAQVTIYKGGSTPGVSKFWAQKFSGAGDLAFFHDYGELAVQNDLHDDGVHWTAQLSGVMKITVAGGIVLAFHARSDGGAGSIAINAYQYVVERIG